MLLYKKSAIDFVHMSYLVNRPLDATFRQTKPLLDLFLLFGACLQLTIPSTFFSRNAADTPLPGIFVHVEEQRRETPNINNTVLHRLQFLT
jgi:hypothetical protein